ncbi:MAG: HDOD domain-containing protein [Thermodesulfobacteriota bacterium]|nr:HDOD domain-containing protein [Thermodesulfobacteriota bacterium]
MDVKTFYKRLDHIQDIPTLSIIAIKVNKMLEDYDTSTTKLCSIIEKDQAIASKILTLVNSSFYGFRSKISSISHAVIVMGFNTVRNAILSVAVIQALSGEEAFEGFDMRDFWRHSISVAVTSRHLAEMTRLEPADNCFVAGLIHDIGKVILSQYFKELFGQVWTSVCEEGLSFYESEKRLLPVDHAQIGAYLAKKWQFPKILVDAIDYHHTPKHDVSNPHLLFITHAADTIVNAYKTDLCNIPVFSYADEALLTKTDEGIIKTDEGITKIMKPQLESMAEWFPTLAADIQSACEFFLQEI